jgi:hypothetical protein
MSYVVNQCDDCGLPTTTTRAYCDPCGILHRGPANADAVDAHLGGESAAHVRDISRLSMTTSGWSFGVAISLKTLALTLDRLAVLHRFVVTGPFTIICGCIGGNPARAAASATR